jgi:hypothetical protein
VVTVSSPDMIFITNKYNNLCSAYGNLKNKNGNGKTKKTKMKNEIRAQG